MGTDLVNNTGKLTKPVRGAHEREKSVDQNKGHRSARGGAERCLEDQTLDLGTDLGFPGSNDCFVEGMIHVHITFVLAALDG